MLGVEHFAVTLTSSDTDVFKNSFGLLVLLVLLGAVVVMPASLFRKWYFYRRRLKKRLITAEYVPPLDLNPAELGYLFDGKLGEREVAATIVHMIQNGLLHMKKTDTGKRIFAGPRVTSQLKSYERKLIEEADSSDGVSGKDLLKRFVTFSAADFSVPASKAVVFTYLVHRDLETRGFVKGSVLKNFFLSTLKVNIVLHILFFYVPFLLFWLFLTLSSGSSDVKTLLVILMMAAVLSVVLSIPVLFAAAILQMMRGKILGREWIITDKLERLWPQIVGYRQYVKLVENERLEFQTTELQKTSKNDTLPYAIALGFVKNWRELF